MAGCCAHSSSDPHSHDDHDANPLVEWGLVALCGIGTLTGWILRDSGWFSAEYANYGYAAYLIGYLAGAAEPFIESIRSLAKLELNVDLLMILAAIGSAVIGDYVEGGILLFLFTLSHALEHYALDSTRRSIRSLMNLRPHEATRHHEGGDERVPIDSLQVGDVVRVRPGDRFPVDGEISEGESWADESTLTGESEPVPKGLGDEVFAGTINGTGGLLVRMTRSVADTTLQRIIHLVEEAQAEKTPAQKFLEAWQGTYVAGVLAAAAFTFFGTWLIHSPDDPSDAFRHMMVLLVAASPCAVVASVPAVMLSAIARGAMGGVLVKGGIHLQILGEVSVIALDKTGTITRGRPQVTEVWSANGGDTEEILRLAAAVEQGSEHPLGETIVRAAQERGLNPPAITAFSSHTGWGVHAFVGDEWVGVGREDLFAAHDVMLSPEITERAAALRLEGKGAMIVASQGLRVAGIVVVADELRPETRGALAALKRQGVEQIIVLTGDHESVARRIANEAGADDVRAELLPEHKVREVRRLMSEGKTLAMVGDGVNDAPALAAASVGIAMGGGGTDVALETADAVLMRDDLTALPFAIWLGRRALDRVKQNMLFSLGVIVFLVLSSFLGLPLWLGVIGHEGSTLVVVLNGVRLLLESPSASETGA